MVHIGPRHYRIGGHELLPPPHVHEGWFAHQLRKFHEYETFANPYTPVATEGTIVACFALVWLIYRNRKCWRTNRRFWYELYCLVLGSCIFYSLYLSCSLEHNCLASGVSVSRLTNRGLIGRVWAFMMVQVACHFVIVQTWLLSYVYKRGIVMHVLFTVFPVAFLVSTVLTPAHMGWLSDILHSFSTVLMGFSGFTSWLWTAYRASKIPALRWHSAFRVVVILLMIALFSLCAVDNVFDDVVTKVWANAFLALEISTIFGICVIHMSIFYGEMRYVDLSTPVAQYNERIGQLRLPM